MDWQYMQLCVCTGVASRQPLMLAMCGLQKAYAKELQETSFL